jgi:anthranilate phosphoribosyltransferase
MMTPQDALNRLIDHNELFYDEMLSLMRQIMAGDIAPELTAAILIGLRVKVESVAEIAAAATVMRELATPVQVNNRTHLVDIVGTGGDRIHTFNISTASSFVTAAAGGQVAKHGNRAVSSQSGSADVLEALGVALDLTPEAIGKCVDEVGVGFMFAPHHHLAMKNVMPIRQLLGVRTLFNILGPLTNPANATRQVMGVFHPDLVGIQARVLQTLKSEHVMVVHGLDGMDEITLTGKTRVAELNNGAIDEYEIDPREFGFSYCELKDLQTGTANQAKEILVQVLKNTPGPARDIVILNAGAAIYVAGLAQDYAEGIAFAQEALASGKAYQKLIDLRRFSQQARPL